MQKPTPKKPALHGAAADTHRKAEDAKDHSKATTAKPTQSGRMPAKASKDVDSGTGSR